MKVAVITGGARGIGKGIAEALAKHDFHLALVDRLGPEVEATARGFGADRALALAGDVADHALAKRLAGQVLERWGRIDVLVNNAGISQPKGLLELSEAEWDRTLAVHLKGCFNWCQAVVPAMQAQGAGRIVNISSVSAHTGGAMAVSKVAYAAAKAGILGLTRALARELAPAITTNAICPGSIVTDLTRDKFAAIMDQVLPSIPQGRLGSPADIGEVVAFLATVTPNFINGEVIDVDGGQWVN